MDHRRVRSEPDTALWVARNFVGYVGGTRGGPNAPIVRAAITSPSVPACKDANSVPARSPQRLGVRGAAEVFSQIRIADIPRQHHSADAQGSEHERARVRPRPVEVVLEDRDQ